jgi:hypothetical protein
MEGIISKRKIKKQKHRSTETECETKDQQGLKRDYETTK